MGKLKKKNTNLNLAAIKGDDFPIKTHGFQDSDDHPLIWTLIEWPLRWDTRRSNDANL